MLSSFRLLAWLSLAAAAASAWPQGALAQTFSADYALTRAAAQAGGASHGPAAPFSVGPVRIGAAFQADARFSGGGLSLDTGSNWYGHVGIGRSLQPSPNLPGGGSYEDVLNIAGGYRWADGQSLLLQLSRTRGTDRLGLSVSYDWPRYFVRMSYDQGLKLTPADVLRFSAGIRF